MFDFLTGPAPHLHLAMMRADGSLARELPEVDRLYGVPQNAEHHPEICTGIHTEMCLQMAERLNASAAARFAVLMHDLGKALTPANELPKHLSHEQRGLAPVREVCARFAVDAYWQRLALLVCELHLDAHRALEMRSKSVLKLLHVHGFEADAGLLEDFLVACESDKRGRLGKEERAYRQGDLLRRAAAALQGLPVLEGIDPQSCAGQERHNERLSAVRAIRKDYPSA